LIKNNHIYTLKHNLKSLKKKERGDELYKFRIGNNYYNNYLVSKEWLWCAVTRATDFNNVYFFKNDKTDEDMFKNLVVNYLKNKVEGCKGQDRKGGRKIVEETH